MAAFDEKLPDWGNTGAEPSAAKKTEGWKVSEKPPADWMNWLFYRAHQALKQLQQYAFNKGTANADVELVKSYIQETDTRSQALTYTNGNVTKVEHKDGAAVVATETLAYNVSTGALDTVTRTAGGQTITETISYDANGNVSGVTRA